MSIVTEHGGKGYAPLPQSMSNTDTENEDEGVEKKSCQSTKHDSTTMQENVRFFPLDESKNLANRLKNGRNTSLGYCSDDIPIMVIDQDANNDLWKRPHMSFLRQLFLAASILLCLATIVIFLYVLPCNESNSLRPAIKNRPALLWDNTLQGMELYGPILVIPGTPRNLVMMYREQLYGDSVGKMQGSMVPLRKGGVISIHGGNGLLLWVVRLSYPPTEIVCKNLNMDKSRMPETTCLVAGEPGLISINSTTGLTQWSISASTHSKLPMLLPDIDGDGIADLLSVVISKDQKKQSPALFSGKSGSLLGQELKPECRRVYVSSLDSNDTISYLCDDSNGKQSTKTITLKELFPRIQYPKAMEKITDELNELQNPVVPSAQNSDQHIVRLTAFHQLGIEHQGTCPGDLCQTIMNITFQKDSNQPRMIWKSYGPNAYGMKPAIFTQINNPLVTGFVMKFWQWTPDSQIDKINSSIVRRTVIERTLVVIIDAAEVHPVNASQTEITQICDGTNCQPSLELQSQSLVVTDLNDDGSRELISYQTSYEFRDNLQLLKSKVEFIMLDAEVAKLTQIIIS
ncbi:uncharacterized protein [Neodiprion pinetum]|uniref:uncharacterized protein n=1 Tax=Neodiprion pinetum TaxID=441929 RepID=UPI001EDD9639|nr:uncharacterized protein LOC124213809 [Neodiprion pinetum]